MAEQSALVSDPTPLTAAGPSRRELDAYYTPQPVADALTKLLLRDGWWRGGTMLEPSVGRGAFVRAAREHLAPDWIDAVDVNSANVIEIQDVAHGVHADFLEYSHASGYSLVLGNPPFNGAEAHVRHALSLRARFGVVAFLLRLAFLESRERLAFWGEHPASAVYVLAERPSFTGGKTDSCAYGFFVWATWHRGPARMEVVSWR